MVQLFKQPKKGRSAKGVSKKSGAGKGKRKISGNNSVETVSIDSLDYQGKGVVRGEHITFVDGAISGEVCKISDIKQHKGVREARVLEVLQASAHRQKPFCPHFTACGGCQTQHIQHDWLAGQKQQALDVSLQKALRNTGQNKELPWISPLISPHTGYRRKARLAVDARKADDIKLGFRDSANQVFNLTECQILEPELQALISPLQQLLKKLHAKKALGHISLFKGNLFAQGHSTESCTVSLRFTKQLVESDLALLRQFAGAHQVLVQLQCADEQWQNLPVNGTTNVTETGYLLHLTAKESVEIALNPNDFVQVNSAINQAMVQRSLQWLDLNEHDRVLDLFCGVGNFTLAMADKCQHVVGFEGVPEMVQNARCNAQRNGIENVNFISGDLSDDDFLSRLRQQNCNKVVLDPARAGALKVMDSLRYLAPELIVYVSCNPATFGRDIAKLLEKSPQSNYKNHYQLVKLSLVDMFPNTSHSEIMGLLRLVS